MNTRRVNTYEKENSNCNSFHKNNNNNYYYQ